MSDLDDEKEKQEEEEEEVSSEETTEAVEEEVVSPAVEEDEEEEQLSVEELEAEIHRLRGSVSKLKSVLWQLGYDGEGKKRI